MSHVTILFAQELESNPANKFENYCTYMIQIHTLKAFKYLFSKQGN